MHSLRIASVVPTVTNPFGLAPIPSTPLFVLKAAIVGVTLFPIRLVVFTVCAAVALLSGALARIGVDPKNPAILSFASSNAANKHFFTVYPQRWTVTLYK